MDSAKIPTAWTYVCLEAMCDAIDVVRRRSGKEVASVWEAFQAAERHSRRQPAPAFVVMLTTDEMRLAEQAMRTYVAESSDHYPQVGAIGQQCLRQLSSALLEVDQPSVSPAAA